MIASERYEVTGARQMIGQRMETIDGVGSLNNISSSVTSTTWRQISTLPGYV